MRNIFNFVKAAAQKAKAKINGVKAAVSRKINRTRAAVNAAAFRLAVRINAQKAQAQMMLAESRGKNFVDSGIKILIAVVIGALLLGGLYALFGETIMPTVTQKVKDMFDFKG